MTEEQRLERRYEGTTNSTSPYLILSCRILSYLILSYLILSYLIMLYVCLLYPVLPHMAPYHCTLSTLNLNHRVLSYLIFSSVPFRSILCLIPSHPILFYLFHLIRFILSYLSRLIFEGSVIENTRRRVASEKGFCSICCRINCLA